MSTSYQSHQTLMFFYFTRVTMIASPIRKQPSSMEPLKKQSSCTVSCQQVLHCNESISVQCEIMYSIGWCSYSYSPPCGICPTLGERTCQCWRAALHSKRCRSHTGRKWKHSPRAPQTTRKKSSNIRPLPDLISS